MGTHPIFEADFDCLTEIKEMDVKERLAALKRKRMAAKTANHRDVVEEDRVAKLPANFEAKKERAQYELGEMERKKEIEASGGNYERAKMLNKTALDLERKDAKRKRTKNPDPGFVSWEDNTARQYNRLTRDFKIDMEKYEEEKQEYGDDFYAGLSTASILPGRIKDSEEAKSRLVNVVKAQIDKRKKFHRRRMHDEDKDITYINERNRKFNEKIDRSYSKYTQEIKQNLERGTAI